MKQPEDTAAEFGKFTTPAPLEIVDACQLFTESITAPPILVEGILHRGHQMQFGGSSKSHKTWGLMDLAVSIATGSPWLGRATEKAPVLFVDFELDRYHFQQRLLRIIEAKKVRIEPGQLDVIPMRGKAADVDSILAGLCATLGDRRHGLSIFDPMYKMLGDRDENSNGEVAQILNSLDQFSVKFGSAVAFASHFSKGNQSEKRSTDRASGAGSWSRAPDTVVTLTEHEEPGAFVLQAVVRNLPTVAASCVRWEFPLLTPAPDLDPTKLKTPARGAQPTFVAASERDSQLRALIPTDGDRCMERNAFAESMNSNLKIAQNRCKGVLDARILAGVLHERAVKGIRASHPVRYVCLDPQPEPELPDMPAAQTQRKKRKK